MKKLFFFFGLLAIGSSKPNGYYHQEYSYKSSSSSFKNNELQHKNEDQGFYSKDGDLEGRVAPKVNSQSQHSEYRNPKLTGGYQAGGYTGAGAANYVAGSEGHYGANSLQHAGAVDGYASADRVLDLSNAYNRRGYNTQDYGANQAYGTSQNYGALNGGGYGGYTQGGSSYGYVQHGSSQATSGSYGTNANLNALMQRLQDDMTRQLEHAIYKQYQTSGYTTSVTNNQMNTDIRLLEEELRRNLTRQLQDSLRTQYGSSNTYTVVEGRPSSVPNYSSQELAALTRRLEDDLISKLHQSVRTTYNRESSNVYTSSSNTYRPVVIYPATTSRPYYDRPVITTPTVMRYSVYPSRETYPGNLVVQTPTNIRYTPIPNPESLTQIASRTQSDINSYLDTALQNLYATYLQADRTSSYTITDFDNEVDRIKDEIIRKLTYNLEAEIRKNYGQQILRDNYYYSMSTNGDISTQSNYNLNDYENLKKQVEENLLRKLNQTTNTYRNEYTQKQQSQYRQSSSNVYTVTYRPTYYTSGNQLYDYSDLQRQLSQQLQKALNQHRYGQSSSYSASTSYNPQNYQTSLDELSRELQRNLTEQLSNYRAHESSSSSSSYGYSSGSSGGSADFESMKNQLQNQLMQQLRQGLQNQYQYSASASYSASSSSSANANYGMHQGYSSYPSTTCLHGCSRRRRDLSSYYQGSSKRHGVKSVRRMFKPQEERYLHYPQELSYPSSHHSMEFSQSSYSKHSSHSKTLNVQHEESEPEIVEDLILSNHATPSTPREDQQQIEQLEASLQQSLRHNKPLKYVGQQQTQDTFPSLQKIQDDLTQQLELGHQSSQQILANIGKLRDQNDFTQLELPHQQHKKHDPEAQVIFSPQNTGHQLEENDMVGHSHISRHHEQEVVGQLNLDQQTQDQNIFGHLQKPKHLDQETQGQLTLGGQQIVDQNIIGNLNEPKLQNQNIEHQLTMGQQIEDQNIIGHLHIPKHDQEPEGQLILGQREDQNIFPSLAAPNRHIQKLESQLTLVEDQDLTQQLELEGTHRPKLLQVQQVEEQNRINRLPKPIYHNQNVQEQLRNDQNPEDLTQQLELEDTNRPKLLQVQQLEDQNRINRLQKPTYYNQNVQKQLRSDQNPEDLTQQLEIENTHRPKLVQVQVEDQNRINRLQKPTYYNQNVQEQLRNDQNPEDLTQQLELEDTHRPKLVQVPQLEDQNTIQQFNKPRTFRNDQNEEDLTQQFELETIRKPSQVQQFSYQNRATNWNRRYNSNINLQPLDKQNDHDLTQQLEIENAPTSQVQTVEEAPTQLLEMDNIQKPKVSDQQLQEQDDLTQQLELSGAPKNNFEQQQSNADISEPSLDQQSQHLEITQPRQVKPLSAYGQQQTEDDDVQKLELENKPKTGLPKYGQELQQTEDLVQQLELSNTKREKSEDDQQLLNQDLDQNLEISRSPEQKLEAQEQSGVTTQVVNADEKLEEPDEKLEVSDQKLKEPVQRLEVSDQKLEEPVQRLEVSDQKLEEPVQKLEEPDQKLEVSDQKLEEPDQKLEGTEQNLELIGLGEPIVRRTSVTPLQSANNQQEEDLTQQLELTDVRKPIEQEQQHLENTLELTESEKPTPDQHFNPNIVSPESELGSASHSVSSSQSTWQSKQTFGHGSEIFNSGQSRPHPTQDYGSRPFTNGHTGDFSDTTSQTTMDSYAKALEQQEALMDLLRKKVQEAHNSNQDLIGRRTIKKTMYINGKLVDSQEKSQLVKPNGEVLELPETTPLEKTFNQRSYAGQLAGYGPSQHQTNTQSTGYSGNTLQTYHITGNPTELSRNSHWFSHEQNPLSHFGTDLYGRGYQGNGQTEYSGKSTRRVVHYVNGKPVSASEKVQIFKPNGEIIERQLDIPTDSLSTFSHGFSNGEIKLNTHGLSLPKTYISNENSASHTFKKTSHYLNGKLVDYSSSSQDSGPMQFDSGIPRTELSDGLHTTPFKLSNFHSSVKKSSRNSDNSYY